MGKNLIQQRRGRGTSTFRAPSFRYLGEAKHAKINSNTIHGKIIDIVHCAGHSSPLAKMKYDNGEEALMIAPEGIRVGDILTVGTSAEIKNGNVLPLKNMPEGTLIYNIESSPGDGGKFVRCSGASAKLISKLPDRIIVRLPSSKQKEFHPECRASIGVIAGAGRTEKPVLKAGNKFYAKKAKNKFWPVMAAQAMNAVCHPFGGKGAHSKNKPTQSSRNAPPGRKVGKIAPSRTGRRKK